ncbi:unnamed protein product [Vitrella brassicaformis CCMP3155]|uniref:Cyclin C-terminal domain-containing protein n=1 Tax=Vitrella brassicaformis (strain CCMP3155) TaxID=1169540 RepID=A0A0G4GDU3_VITBC|nr:unnamed protein product [Vitrella brassicaformis CCMP3155]|eukprot:CEM27539.1 unnamed protein product [Vitrella brassicaformis CCMP3155]
MSSIMSAVKETVPELKGSVVPMSSVMRRSSSSSEVSKPLKRVSFVSSTAASTVEVEAEQHTHAENETHTENERHDLMQLVEVLMSREKDPHLVSGPMSEFCLACRGLSLSPTVFQLSVNLMDRFCAKTNIALTPSEIGLMTPNFLLLACKSHDDIKGEIVSMTSAFLSVYTQCDAAEASRQVKRLSQQEGMILSCLNYRVHTAVLPSQLYDVFAEVGGITADHPQGCPKTVGVYLLELSLIEGLHLDFFLSTLAASCTLLVLLLLGREWTDELTTVTKHTRDELAMCAREVIKLHERALDEYAYLEYHIGACCITSDWNPNQIALRAYTHRPDGSPGFASFHFPQPLVAWAYTPHHDSDYPTD